MERRPLREDFGLNTQFKWLIILAAVVAVALLFRAPFKNIGRPTQKAEYWQFINDIEKGRVLKGVFKRDRFAGELTTGERFYVDLFEPPEADRQYLVQTLRKHHVKFTVEKAVFGDMLQTVLVGVIAPLALIFMFWLIIMRQAQSTGNQALSFGRSRAKRFSESVPKVTFEDVAGVEEAKQELCEVVEFLRHPKKFQSLGAKIPKGVLLLGPPGCGKTLLARAIAGEAGVPFFHISGSDFVEMFVGVGASRVRDLFDTAKQHRPSIVFIDEIDAVGRQRGAGLGGGHDEREQTLNQLLVEMDGFDPNQGVILVAATNRPDVLDPALLRPGRFDRRVVVDSPDANGRKAILEVHSRGKPMAEDVDLDNLARRTPGFTGADLENLANEAALLAARRDKSRVEMSDFEESIDRVIAGPERKSRLLGEEEKRMVAYHEVGHAMVSEMLPKADPVHKVSILPRGMALGYVMQLPTQDKYLTTRSELVDHIAGRMAGRVAEEVIFGEVSTGDNDDLDRATELARAMVCEYGMSEELGPLTFGRRHGNPFLGRDIVEDRNYSEQVAVAIDQEVRKIIDGAYARARDIVLAHREKLDEIVAILLEKETLDRDEFLALMGDLVPEPKQIEPTRTRSPEPEESADRPKSEPEPKPRLEPGVA